MSKQEFEDDGRTIVDMSYTKEGPSLLGFTALSKRKVKAEKLIQPNVEMSKKESRRFMFSAMLAGLAIALVFVGVFFLFLLFCVHVWF